MGKLILEHSVSHILTMIHGNGTPDEIAKKTADRAFKYLPDGTRWISTTPKHNMASMHYSYETIFDHPLFDDGTKIEMFWYRDIYAYVDAKGQEQIKEFDLFRGIQYIKPDGTPKYLPTLI